MAKSGNVELHVFGQRIVLKHRADNPELVARVVELVSAKIGEAERKAPGSAPHQVALVALMDLAAEYIQAKERTLEFKREVDAKTGQILEWVKAEGK
jgi:cell division protein ZapA (FtsZ GTPase activity inhibitor)